MPKCGAGLSSEVVHTLGEFCDALMDSEVVAAFPCGRPRETRIATRIGFGRPSTNAPIRFWSQNMPHTPKKEVKLKAAAGIAPPVYSFSLVLQGASDLTPEIADGRCTRLAAMTHWSVAVTECSLPNSIGRLLHRPRQSSRLFGKSSPLAWDLL